MLNGFKRARLISGMTQIELAKQLGVSNVSVSDWENGKRMPRTKRLKQIANVLHTTIAALFGEDGL